MTRRVVITGLGLTTPIGHSLDEVSQALQEKRHGISKQPKWDSVEQLQTRLAGEISDLEVKRWPRKKIRSMGRVALLSTYATERAIEDAKVDPEALKTGKAGLAFGSTHGSSTALENFATTLFMNSSLKGLPSSSYLKFMSHTCAANLAQFYGIRGRIISTCAACVSASQAIGSGYEAIKHGAQELMICGGAEELHFVHAAVFDIMFATSYHYNEAPDRSPRPFDKMRDGLVVAEGAGAVVLEDYERAKARGAHIYAEVMGYGTNCDGTHVTAPSKEGMADSMRLALSDAKMAPSDVGYINAHATATPVGDVCESEATNEVMGSGIPISSTKGYTGHTLGACGAIEVGFCLAMMRDGFLAQSRNLDEVDERCAPLDYIMGDHRREALEVAMTNNFAFGGINTSLVLKKL